MRLSGVLGVMATWVAFAGIVLSSAQPATPISPGESYQPARGPYPVKTIEQILLPDPARHKQLPIKVYYPAAPGRFPVIVFSHGLGGSKEFYADLANDWAAHGYVSIHPTHDDSYQLQIPRGRSVRSVMAALRDPDAWVNRFRDISLVLDSLGSIEKAVPDLRGRLDNARIGVGGHSFGAYTAMVIGGARISLPGKPGLQSFQDPRVRAILVLSPEGPGGQGLTGHSWDSVSLPMMTMTGSWDVPNWKTLPYLHAPPGNKYHLFIEGATHMSFVGRLAPGTSPLARRIWSTPTPQKAAIFAYIQTASLAFWDAYIGHSPAAKAYLESDALARLSHGAVKLSRK